MVDSSVWTAVRLIAGARLLVIEEHGEHSVVVDLGTIDRLRDITATVHEVVERQADPVVDLTGVAGTRSHAPVSYTHLTLPTIYSV